MAPRLKTRSRHFGESPATFPSAQTAYIFKREVRLVKSHLFLRSKRVKFWYLFADFLIRGGEKMDEYGDSTTLNDDISVL